MKGNSNQLCANPDSDSNPDSSHFGLDLDSDSHLEKLNPDSRKNWWIQGCWIRIRIHEK